MSICHLYVLWPVLHWYCIGRHWADLWTSESVFLGQYVWPMFTIASALQGRYLCRLDGYKKKITYLEVFMVCEDTRQAKCNTCGQTVSCGGGTPKTFNTTNLVQHLKAKHPTEYAHFWEKVVADATTMAVCKVSKTPANARSGGRQCTLLGHQWCSCTKDP